MTITVETGALVALANSYVTEAQVEAYMESANKLVAWEAATDEVREATIIIGQMAMDGYYGSLYYGYPVSRNQTMAWPRTRVMNNPLAANQLEQKAVIDDNGYEWLITEIPTPVINAALQAIVVEFEGTFTAQTLTKADYIKKKKVDVLETEYFPGAPAQSFHTLVDFMLRTVSDAGGPNQIEMRIGLTPQEQSAGYYNWPYAVHNWTGAEYSTYGGWEPYRDLALYFYQAKGWL